ncbi:hypothetical protein KKG55_04755 [Candidatus Micrarchaeota archaeon]|nr:hypothetical protein [Candidatus Micrarchaeota archaeon]MBU1887023.1 hypothetical protein [Candidatus Micrarchaeota archaeon]
MNSDKIKVVFATSRSIASLIHKKMNEKLLWTYLGENAVQTIKIENETPNWKRISIADALQKHAKKTSGAYTEYISSLCNKKGIEWWASRVSEKNPFVSRAFLHICYLKVAGELIEGNKCQIIFIEDKDVFDSVMKNYNDSVVSNISIVNKVAAFFGCGLKIITSKLRFLAVNIHHVIFTRYLDRDGKKEPKKNLTIVHTFANKRSFDGNGNFRDSYFGKMPEWLEKNDRTVVFLPRILDSRIYKETASKLAKNNGVLLWYDYVSILDVFASFSRELASVFSIIKTETTKFQGLDISDIIKRDRTMDLIENRRASDRLLYFAIKRMAKKGLRISEFLYTYENQCWEKILISALRKFYPECRIIGYQHAAFSDMQLNYFFTDSDKKSMPFPDRLILSGQYYMDLFSKRGYEKSKMIIGGSFRFAYLLEQKATEDVNVSNGNHVLVTFPMDENQAAELYMKIVNAFDGDSTKVILKFHPFSNRSKILGSNGMRMSENFEISDATMPEALKKSGTVIYTSSTTCIEAISNGIMPIAVKSDHFIDMDQLESYQDARLVAKTPEEIRECAKKALGMNVGKEATEIVSQRFAKVDMDKIMAAFESE